ncbi:glycosyltransferase [Flavitalea sp.]|nr:glycosyltransferase [Flavitalea sp.]
MIATQIAAVVVMYHPEISFLKNIATYADQVTRLFIIDNSEFPDEDFYKSFRSDPKVVIISDKINHGIAKALNIAGEKAKQEGFDWLLTMDQDSSFDPGVLSAYFQAADAYPAKEAVAVFGLPYDKEFLSSRPADEFYVEVNSLITSGCLLNLQLFEKLEGFNEKLFIDEVDHDYCYRAILSGYKVVVIKAGLMRHTLGRSLELTNKRNLSSGLKTLHNPIRIYYIVRNGLYVSGKFKNEFPKESAKRRKIIYVTVKNNLLYGDQKLAVLKYAILGLWHNVIKRYGRF